MRAALVGAAEELAARGKIVPPSAPTGTDPAQAFQALVDAGQGDPNTTYLVFAAISAMAGSLQDEHTGFIPPPKALSGAKEPIAFLGVIGRRNSEGFLVADVMPGSTAEAAEVHPGDVIRAVASPAPADAALRLTVARQGQTIELRALPQSAPPALLKASMLTGRVGYIRLYEFRTSGACDSLSSSILVRPLAKQLGDQGIRQASGSASDSEPATCSQRKEPGLVHPYKRHRRTDITPRESLR
jgi:C-terminal processing protease CtpA/Prc